MEKKEFMLKEQMRNLVKAWIRNRRANGEMDGYSELQSFIHISVEEFLEMHQRYYVNEMKLTVYDISLPNEEWRIINEFPNYMISNMGRVWSEQHCKVMKGQLKPRKKYLYVYLKTASGQYKRMAIHRLVAIAFIPNPNNLPQVDHIDECHDNNKAINLRWVSGEDNINYYMKNHGIK